MFEVVWGLVAPVMGLVAVLRARSWAERSVAAEERSSATGYATGSDGAD